MLLKAFLILADLHTHQALEMLVFMSGLHVAFNNSFALGRKITSSTLFKIKLYFRLL